VESDIRRERRGNDVRDLPAGEEVHCAGLGSVAVGWRYRKFGSYGNNP